MAKLEHWIRRLPEAGAITRHAAIIEEYWAAIAAHQNAISELRGMLGAAEQKALQQVLANGWSLADVNSARTGWLSMASANRLIKIQGKPLRNPDSATG